MGQGNTTIGVTCSVAVNRSSAAGQSTRSRMAETASPWVIRSACSATSRIAHREPPHRAETEERRGYVSGCPRQRADSRHLRVRVLVVGGTDRPEPRPLDRAHRTGPPPTGQFDRHPSAQRVPCLVRGLDASAVEESLGLVGQMADGAELPKRWAATVSRRRRCQHLERGLEMRCDAVPHGSRHSHPVQQDDQRFLGDISA